MTNNWQPPPVSEWWWGSHNAVWSVGYFLPGDAPVPRLVTFSAGGRDLPYDTFIRYGWCANAGRCNPADLCSADARVYDSDNHSRYASQSHGFIFVANPGQDYFIVLFSTSHYVSRYLGTCANPVLLADLPLNGQLTFTPGPRSCSDMTRSMNLYWGSPWDAGYLLPGNPTWHRQLTVDTCLLGVPGSAVGYPLSLAVTALASTSGLCRLASAGALGYMDVVTSADGCGGRLNFTARVGQAYLITVSGFTPGFVTRGSCSNPVIISNLPSNGVLNIPFEERSCQDMTNTWQPPPAYEWWWGSHYAVWSVGYFLPGDAPVPRLVTLSAGGQDLPYYTFIRYGWCANAGRCNPADLCSLYDRVYDSDYQARYAMNLPALNFIANPGQDYFIVLFSMWQYVSQCDITPHCENGVAMDRFVVRDIIADDAAENLLRQVDKHDEMLHQKALDREDDANNGSASTSSANNSSGGNNNSDVSSAISGGGVDVNVCPPLVMQVEIKDHLLALRQGGVALNHTTARSVMLAVIQQREPHLLSSNGGALRLSAQYVRDFLEHQLNWVTRRSTGDSQHLPVNYTQLVEDMDLRAALIVYAKRIPPELFYSMDETFVFFAPMAGSTTLAEEGSKQVFVAATEQKKGLTVCLTVKASGHVLPLQLIYEGKTDLSTPGGKPKNARAWQPLPARVAADAAGHDVTATPSHWATEDSHKQHFERVILLDYFLATPSTSCQTVLEWFKQNYPFVHFLFVPAGTTPVAQVLDTAINRPFKHHIKQSFIQDSVQQITSQLDAGTAAEDTKLDLSGKYLKPFSLVWAVAAHQHINSMSDLVLSGYKNAGTVRAFDDSYQRAAMTEMGRLFGVFEDEQNAGAVEDDAAVEANDLEAALLARPAHKPLPGMIVPMEDSPLLTEQVAGIDVQSMTAVELMVAAQQWNKPKPPAAQATPTPTRKQARLVCNTSSSANSSSANTSSASNSSGDNSSSEDGSANNEEWVVSKLAAGVAGCKKSAVGVVGQARAATDLGTCANPVILADLPLNGQLTFTPGPRNCSDMTRSMNLYWGSPWDVGYLLPGNPTWLRQFTVDTCLPGVPGSAVGYPLSLAVTTLASTSGLCRLASAGALGYMDVVTSANGCGGRLNFTARVGQAYLITVSGFTPGFVTRGSCSNPVMISSLPSNGLLNIPFEERSCQDMTNTWQPPPAYEWWYAAWSVGYFLPGDAPVPRLVTLTAGGQNLPYYTFIRYGWCANAGRCNPANLCSADARVYDSDYQPRFAAVLNFVANPGQDYFIVVFSSSYYVTSVVLQPAPSTSTCGLPSSWDTWSSSDFTYLLLPDVATPRHLTLETCPPGSQGWDTVLRVVQAEPGKCGQRATWAMEDDDSSFQGGGCSRLTFTAAPGLHYFIVVEGFRQS
ncbi:hypothetical protein QJQ45_025180, partial [Haematococcus lacustris]